MTHRLTFAARTALTLVTAAAAACCATAHAYGPFAGTDAGVVQPGLFELEINAGDVRGAGQHSVYLPAVVGAFGLGGDTEMAIEGRLERRPGARAGLRNTAVTVKHVLRRGSLQDEGGVSIAAECSLLLPEARGEAGIGAACIGAMSQRWEQGALHLNAGYARGRDNARERSAGIIVEGPEAWTVRPVAELTAAREAGGQSRRALLLGANWKHSEDLSLHLAMRRERSGDEHLNEVRFGLTWPLSAKK